MSVPVVTQERLSQAFHYDPISGNLYWKEDRGTARVGARAGSVSNVGYRIISIDGRNYREHRIIWFMTHGRWPSPFIDHIDGDKANNRLSNLREATSSLNNQNRNKPQRHSLLKVLGVSRKRDRFYAEIGVNGERKKLGGFESLEEAAKAYRDAKKEFHGVVLTEQMQFGGHI